MQRPCGRIRDCGPQGKKFLINWHNYLSVFIHARLISKVFKPGVGFMRAAALAAVCVGKEIDRRI